MPPLAASLPLLLVLASPAAPGPGGDTVVATYRDGEVTASEVAAWSRFVELDGGSTKGLSLESRVQEIVVLEALARRFEAAPAAAREEVEGQRRALDAKLAERALRRHLLARAEPTEAALRRLYAARREALAEPRRWRLEDVFKSFPEGADEATRSAVRSALAAVRERLLAGAEFAAVARAESESSTRLRSGAMGFVTLDRLAPPLARAVAELGQGEISPLVELPRGVVIVRCVQVIEAHSPSFEEAREGLATELRNQRFEELWDEAARRGEPGLEAERLGLTRTPDQELLRRFKHLELAAQAAANEATRDEIGEPSDDELRAAFEAQPRGWSAPRRSQLRVLRVPIRNHLPASFYDRVRRHGRELSAPAGDGGPRSLEAVAADLAPHAEIEDLGWKTDDEIWALGMNADAAVRDLDPGELSPAVQESQTFLIFQLVARQDERRLALAEARPQVRAALLDRRRREAGERLRQRVFDEQAIRMRTSE